MPSRRQLQHRFRGRAGFSVLDAIASMSVFGILMAIGAPSIASIATAMNLESESTRLSMVLTQGRMAAINRGHVVVATFTTTGYTITDSQQGNEVLAAGTLPTGVTLETSGPVSFTPVGTLNAPL